MPTIGNMAVDLVPELIRKYGVVGRPYTCYPSPDQFIDAFDAAVYDAWLQERDRHGSARPLALYVHLPLSKTRAGKDSAAWGATYLQHLHREIALVADCLKTDRLVAQLTWGGGSPAFLSDGQLIQLLRAVRSTFRVAPMGDHSVTIDPCTASVERIALLAALGVNRLVVGAVDTDAELLAGAAWVPVIEQTERMLRAARQARFRSVAVDVLYGLPGQDINSFTDALAAALACAPDRVALCPYMEAGSSGMPQRSARAKGAPAEAMVEMFTAGIERLQAAGYMCSGMDQFALLRDDLAKAQLQGRLCCDCRGYSTAEHCDTLGLGVAALGQIGPTYSQNHTELEAYYDRVGRGKLPVGRGIKLTRDDLVRRSVIEALICHFEISMESIGIAYLIDFKRYFANELGMLAQFLRDGMIEMDQDWISVTPRGKPLVRAICKVFDSRSR